MNIDLTDEQAELAATTRRFITTTMPTTQVRALAKEPAGFERDWWRRCAELGWTYMLAADDARATTEGLTELAIVAEEVGRGVAPGPLVPTNIVAWALANAARPAAREHYLAGLTTGELIGAWAIADARGSWDPATLAVTAERTPDGVLLDGATSYVESGADADVILVTARTADGDLIQALVLPSDPGVGATRLDGIDLVRRFADIELARVPVPAERILDASASTADDVDRQLQIAVALQCAEMVGAVDRVFEFTLEWSFDRYSFGRPLASYQALKHRFADMKMWLEASLAAASACVNSVARGDSDAAEAVSIAKSYIGEHGPEIIQDCVQMHGGIGVTWEHDIHLYLRRVVLDRALFGDPATHRQRVADLLGV